MKTLLELLDSRARWGFLRVVLWIGFASILELVSVTAVFPFMGLVVKPELIEGNHHLANFYAFFSFQSYRSFLIFVGIVMVISVLLANVFKALAERAGKRWAGQVNVEVLDRLLRIYLGRPYEWFLRQETTETASRIAAVTAVTEGLLEPIVAVISGVGSTCLVLLGLLFLDPLIATSLTVIIGGSYVLLYGYLRGLFHGLGEKEWARKREANRATLRALRGIRDIKLSGREPHFLKKVTEPSKGAMESRVSRMLLSMVPSYLMTTLLYVALLLTTIFLVARHPDPSVSVPLLSLYAMAGFRLLPALQIVFENAARIKSNLPILSDLGQDLQHQAGDEDLQDRLDHLPFKLVQGIEFRELRFGYDQEKFLQLSLSIPKGTKLGVVGETGAGKSTLLGILSGLLKSQDGDFLVDGKRLDEGELLRYRHSLGVVSQNTYALNDSLKRNIAFGICDKRIDTERVWEVIRMSQLEEFVKSLEDGLETLLGEQGSRFSSGQLQRVGIARALYHDPDVLILDEACSHLDAQTERAFLDQLETNLKDKTVVLVSHRLGAMKAVDVICVLVDGQIAEQGTFEELIKRDGRFQEMLLSPAPKARRVDDYPG